MQARKKTLNLTKKITFAKFIHNHVPNHQETQDGQELDNPIDSDNEKMSLVKSNENKIGCVHAKK